MDEKTILVADDTPQNRRTYTPQVIQAFALQDVPLKDAMTIVRSLIGAKNIAVGETQNLLVLRDTDDKVRIVEPLGLLGLTPEGRGRGDARRARSGRRPKGDAGSGQGKEKVESPWQADLSKKTMGKPSIFT